MTDLQFREHDKDLVLEVVRYYMDMNLRHKVMQETPDAYNRWMGEEIMKVTWDPQVVANVIKV